MEKMKKEFLSVTIFFLSSSVCLAQPIITDSKTSPPFSPEKISLSSEESQSTAAIWTPDQTIINNLSDEVLVEGFAVRPPQDYSLIEILGPEGAKFFNWKGVIRKDKTYPHLTMSVVMVSPDENHDYSALESLRVLLSGIEQNRGEWDVSTEEEGQINGVDFVRAYWTGTEKTSGTQMKGFMYVMVDGKKIVSLASQDSAANEAALKIAEAAALTFRRKVN